MVFMLDDVEERTREGTTAAAMFFNLYSTTHVHGQAAAYAIWASACIVFFFLNQKPAKKIVAFVLFSLFISFILHFIRYILILNDTQVRTDYRYESSVSLMFLRMGIFALLIAVLRCLQPGHFCMAFCYVAFLPLFGLNAAYVIKDFILSQSAIYEWIHYTGIWRLKDRDLGYSMTPSMIDEFKGDQRWSYIDFMATRMEELLPYEYRDKHIIVGVVTDALTLFLVLLFVFALLAPSLPLKESYRARRPFLALSVVGLLFSAVFRLVFTIHFVLGNWMVLRDEDKWKAWMSAFRSSRYNNVYGLDEGEYAPSSFIAGYRATVEGFPVIQAFLEPMGITLACAALVLANRAKGKLVEKSKVTVAHPIVV